MSSFEAPTAARSGSRVAVLGKRPSLQHRRSDPEFSDAELDDAVDMGENAVWANLEEPIYTEKDVEIFRPTQKDSSLPVYYAKGWLPFSADTLFDALMDAQYRKQWDKNVHQIHVVEHQHVSDVMYFALNLPWPLANRDYVYRRRVKFYPTQNAFVVLCQAAHHADAPANGVRVRVETCTLRLCIRSMSSSNDSCDFHLEYEDDTNFSIPNYVVNILLHTMMPSFIAELRKACKEYVDYIKTLNDNGVQSIPSQVVRHRSVVMAAATSSVAGSTSSLGSKGISASLSEERKPVQRPRNSLFFTSNRTKRKPGLVRRETDEHSSMSEDWEADDAPRSEPPTTQSVRPSVIPRSFSTETGTTYRDVGAQLQHSSSANSLHSASFLNGASSISEFSHASSVASAQRSADGPVTTVDDDFSVEFRKQKIGLHLETDLFSSKVLVAFCEKDSEAAACKERIEPGFLVTSVNGVSVSDFKFTDILSEIQRASRPLTLGFTHPDREASLQYRRFKEPQNVLRCLVSRDENDLLGALRPLDEDAAVSAVLKCDFAAPAATSSSAKAKLTPKSSSPAVLETPSSLCTEAPVLHPSVSLPPSGTDRVLVPAGYLVYEINDSYVLDVPFAEIAHLLRRSGDICVVTFKAAMAVVGGNKPRSSKSRHKISRRISGVFRKKRRASDASITASMSSTSSREWPSERELLSQSRDESYDGEVAQSTSVNVGDSGLADYSSVIVTTGNMEWVWQQVLLLKAAERIFSAALLIDRLESFLADCGTTNKVVIATKTKVLRAMHAERELIDHIKERRNDGMQALKEFSDREGDDEWQLGQTMLGVTTAWKPDEDGSVWIKMEGLVDGVDIFNTISVIREVDLYSVWTPFCSQSLLLQDLGHVELAAYLAISSPFLQRDAIIRAFGINAVYEKRCLLLLGGSVDVSSVTSSVPVPTLQGWNAGRMEIKGFRALIEPLTRMQVRTCIVANIDPKCAIPKPMLNFGIKKMAGILLYLIRKEAEKIEHDHKKPMASATNEHIRRITCDPSGFYTWLRPIVDKYFVDQHNSNLPEPLFLTSDGHIESIADADMPIVSKNGSKSTRTGSPRLAKRRSSTRIAAFQRNAVSAYSVDNTGTLRETPSTSTKTNWSDYLHDFIIWPYLLLFIFAKTSADLPLLYACVLKFLFTCMCTWLAVPGAFPRVTRQWKRARNELEPLRRQCVVLAAICDVLSSYALRLWVRWVQCYLSAVLHGSTSTTLCSSRSPMEVREAEQFAMIVLCFLYASAIVGVQIAVNL